MGDMCARSISTGPAGANGANGDRYKLRHSAVCERRLAVRPVDEQRFEMSQFAPVPIWNTLHEVIGVDVDGDAHAGTRAGARDRRGKSPGQVAAERRLDDDVETIPALGPLDHTRRGP